LVDAPRPGKVTGGLFDDSDVVDGLKRPPQQFRVHIDTGRVIVHMIEMPIAASILREYLTISRSESFQ
jgi:hypothetical protein